MCLDEDDVVAVVIGEESNHHEQHGGEQGGSEQGEMFHRFFLSEVVLKGRLEEGLERGRGKVKNKKGERV